MKSTPFYKTPSEHVERLSEGLAQTLGIAVSDYLDLNLDAGRTQLGYVIGDADPKGINHLGQETIELEIELRLHVAVTKEANSRNTQRYALDLSSKIVSSLKHCCYGLDNQRENPVIESNDALAMSYHKQHQYCVRSIVFRQVVYAGAIAQDLYDVYFEGF